MRGSGGTDGGMAQFWIGFLLSGLALYLFLNSVRVMDGQFGALSGLMGGRGGGLRETTSMGILFVPFFIGVLALFYDAKMKWAWVLMWLGVAILVIEILSRVRFHMNMKTTSLLGMFVLFAAGAALMLRSYRGKAAPWDDNEPADSEAKSDGDAE